MSFERLELRLLLRFVDLANTFSFGESLFDEGDMVGKGYRRIDVDGRLALSTISVYMESAVGERQNKHAQL